MTPLPQKATVCVISARRYGDAIINAAMTKLASDTRPDINWIIWTKPQFVPLFRLMGFTNIITSEFPIAGGVPNFTKDLGKSLFNAITKLRKMDINVSLDFIGDFRESFLGAMICGKRHHSPQWSNEHWMKRLVWRLPNPFIEIVPIDNKQQQVYEVQKKLLSKIVGHQLDHRIAITPLSDHHKIAFHPFSSQPFKLWPFKNWMTLTHLLKKGGVSPIVLCSADESRQANIHFSGVKIPVDIKSCSSIDELIAEIKKIDLLIGVDSFLVHLAAALGKRVIVINAGNLPSWWAPPNSIAIGQSGGCSYYPCSNEPHCLGTPHQSECIKSIAPEEIAVAADAILGPNKTRQQWH